jgi:hypothetical protein
VQPAGRDDDYLNYLLSGAPRDWLPAATGRGPATRPPGSPAARGAASPATGDAETSADPMDWQPSRADPDPSQPTG